MQMRVLTLRYDDGLQGFPEEALIKACAGFEVLECKEHFYIHGGIPHLTLVLSLNSSAPIVKKGKKSGDDPYNELSSQEQILYRQLREWRNQRAKEEGIPSYVIIRNQLMAELCRKCPNSLAGLKEIVGIGESFCSKYGKDVLAIISELSKQQ